jgi:hypothetical protein
MEGERVMMKLESEERERVVGSFRDGLYSKNCHHLFRKYHAFGFAHSVIEISTQSAEQTLTRTQP